MNKFTISWNMCIQERSFNEKNRCCFWKQQLNAEWNMKTICAQNKQRNPAFIEIHRKSVAGECIISGALELQDENKRILLKKKFVCLLENDSRCTSIDLKYPHDTVKPPPPKMFLLTGELLISARTEASLCLTELVHLSTSDYSSLRHFSNDMEKLTFEKSFFADVSLKCGSVTIPAHKPILSVRSPVFKVMFSCPLKEAIENEVIIKDIEPPVLQAMVKYIYSGKVEDINPSLAADLLFAANKYQIACLETACSNYLMSNMSMKNALSVLVIGDYISPDMKNFAIDFICNKCTDYSALEKTSDWITLKNKMPTLALEIFSYVVKSQEQKLKSAHTMA